MDSDFSTKRQWSDSSDQARPGFADNIRTEPKFEPKMDDTVHDDRKGLAEKIVPDHKKATEQLSRDINHWRDDFADRLEPKGATTTFVGEKDKSFALQLADTADHARQNLADHIRPKPQLFGDHVVPDARVGLAQSSVQPEPKPFSQGMSDDLRFRGNLADIQPKPTTQKTTGTESFSDFMGANKTAEPLHLQSKPATEVGGFKRDEF